MAGGRRFIPPVSARLSDEKVDRVRRNQDERITELQRIPVLGGHLIRNISLEDAVNTHVFHGLGRRASVFLSPVRGDPSSTGRIEDATEVVEADRSKYVVLTASGWGTTVVVDAWVF